MVSCRGNSRQYFEMLVNGGAPSEIAQACGVHPVSVSSWMSRNRQEVEEAQQIYRDRLIDALVLDRLTRARQEDSGLHVTQDASQAARRPPPVMQQLDTNTATD